jgi:hypothetical protein
MNARDTLHIERIKMDIIWEAIKTSVPELLEFFEGE